MSYYVYELRDPRDGSVFYVGKGKGPRIEQHEREADKGRQSRKCERIRAIKADGHCIVKAKVQHFANEQEAFDFEAELVEQYGLANLTNVVPGNGRVKSIAINGSVLDLQSIVESMKRGAAAVIERRGVEWANAIVKRFNVSFVVNG